MKPLKTAFDRLFQRYVDIRRGNRQAEKYCYKKTNSVLLTFDDYASADQTTRILKILDEHQVRGMFFFQGDWATKQPDLVQRFRDAGHIIGNHTFTHADLRTLSDAAAEQEIGREPFAQPWFRPPYGSYDRRIRNIAKRLGYVVCYWTIDSQDWTGHATPQSILDRIIPRLHKGAVILLHAHIEATIETLPQLIVEIKQRGYRLDSLSDPTWKPGE